MCKETERCGGLLLDAIVVEVQPKGLGDEGVEQLVFLHHERVVAIALAETTITQIEQGLKILFAVFVVVAWCVSP